MKQITRSCIALLFVISYLEISAQESQEVVGGSYVHNPTNLACLTAEDYAYYHQVIADNIADLEGRQQRAYSPERSSQQVALEWPISQAAGFTYNSTWAISNYVDHDDTTGSLEDWNCGTRTYDTASGYDHQGIDIYLWPFSWQQVDQGQTEVIAAADGQIVFKRDGSFDMNCALNSEQWNAIYIEHSDGSIAWYGHMKNGSLTSKNVGDMVVTGEKIGIVASSGNSTGPHLHLELYDDTNALIDPYLGACNPTTTSSWWADQKDYLNTGINAALTHSDVPDFGTCPDIETTYESDDFQPEALVYFIGYFKDQVSGTAALYEVFSPNGSLFSTWTVDFTDDYYSSWWGNGLTLNAEEGTWSFRISYNGEVLAHAFNVAELSVGEEDVLQLSAYPNPTFNTIELSTVIPMEGYVIRDAIGKTVAQRKGV
ncbi:MAG: murein DD-endopeptidase MepM/ murein hydrolase activator NlpD, partial [Dokdonia sp.]